MKGFLQLMGEWLLILLSTPLIIIVMAIVIVFDALAYPIYNNR